MTPQTSILDQAFAYVPARNTDVQQTWRRFAWAPISDEERQTRVKRAFGEQGATSDRNGVNR